MKLEPKAGIEPATICLQSPKHEGPHAIRDSEVEKEVAYVKNSASRLSLSEIEPGAGWFALVANLRPGASAGNPSASIRDLAQIEQ